MTQIVRILNCELPVLGIKLVKCLEPTNMRIKRKILCSEEGNISQAGACKPRHV
jgi:hypothetical protein